MIRDYEALHYHVASRQDAPFDWGSDKNDCVSFWASCVEAQIGENPLSREPVLVWDTQEEAETVLESLGGLEAAVSARMTEIPPAMAQRGDGGLVRGLRIVMMVEGETLCGPGPDGLIRLPREAMITAWSAV